MLHMPWIRYITPFLCLPLITAGKVVFVNDDASDGGDGSSWVQAYRYLQDGLQATSPTDEIWIAAGTYKPDIGGNKVTGDRTATFQLKQQVPLYGGFQGNETLRKDRDWKKNVTVLSGEISDHPSNWSLHVITSINTEWILDGFHVIRGNADGQDDRGYGGGLYIKPLAHHRPLVRNCIFRENHASLGGGGMGIIQDGNDLAGTNRIQNCVFESNHTNGNGGGLFIKTGLVAKYQIINSVFTNNSAANGGGLYLDSLDGGNLINCVITENEVSGIGGGVASKYLNLIHCTVVDNEAAVGGGLSLINYGSVRNSIIWGNAATLANPGIHINAGLADSRFVKDPINAAPLAFSHCLIEGGGSGTAIYGKSTQKPGFINSDNPIGIDRTWGTADDGLRLKSDSPAVGLGNGEHIPKDLLDIDEDGNLEEILPFDLAGFLRVQGAAVDIGAYEEGDVINEIAILAATIPANGGTVEGTGYFNLDQTATLTAIPAGGYVFNGWSGDASGSVNPLHIHVRKSRKVQALFQPDVDEDTLPDGWESSNGLDPSVFSKEGDLDNDGASNFLEFIYRTEPDDTSSFPTYTKKLFNSLAPIRFYYPTGDEDVAIWRTLKFKDNSWHTGTAAIGLDPNGDFPSLVQTDLSSTWTVGQRSLYTRIEFNSGPPGIISRLWLKLRYVDGFIAYLNGVEIARKNAPAIPKWDSYASETREPRASRTQEIFDLTNKTAQLVEGQNIIAIHLLKADALEDTVLLTASLDAEYQLIDPQGNGDADQDGLLNLEEGLFRTNPVDADTDGDGHSDKEERDKGSDPLDALSLPPPKVIFPDPILEGLIRKALNRPTGDLTTRELRDLTVFESSGKGLALLEGLQYAVNLKKLILGEHAIQSISTLGTLKKLEELILLGTQVVDLSPLADLQNLKSVTLHQNQFANLDALATLEALQYLSVSETAIADLSPLDDLIYLEDLSILGMQVQSTSFLEKLGRLTSLNLSSNEIKDLQHIGNIEGLSSLMLYQNQISNLAPLANLGNLRILGLSGNLIIDLASLGNLNNLQVLSLAQNRISDVNPLSGLITLRGLDLSGNRIANLTPLAELQQIRELRLGQNRIQDPSPISSLNGLLELQLQDNRMDLNDPEVLTALNKVSSNGALVQTSPQDRIIAIADDNLARLLRDAMGKPLKEEFTLSELRALNTLDAKSANIDSLDGLEHASNLMSLKLQNNRITDLSPIREFTNLSHLDLSNNPIHDIELLAGLGSLGELRLNSTLVSDLGPLEKLAQLEILSLDNAQVTELAPLSRLHALKILNLAQNYINDLSPMQNLHSLEEIHLGGNFINLNAGSEDRIILNRWSQQGIRHITDNQKTVLVPILNVQWAIEIKWVSQLGIRYQIHESPDLKTWTPFGQVIIGTGVSLRKLISRDGRERRFYEVRVSP